VRAELEELVFVEGGIVGVDCAMVGLEIREELRIEEEDERGGGEDAAVEVVEEAVVAGA